MKFMRILRGGSWLSFEISARSTVRGEEFAPIWDYNIGLRIMDVR